MSIQTELTRLTNAKAAIQTAIEGKGVTVPEGTLLDGMASLIEGIEVGGDVPDFGHTISFGTHTPADNKTGSSVRIKTDLNKVYAAFIWCDRLFTDPAQSNNAIICGAMIADSAGWTYSDSTYRNISCWNYKSTSGSLNGGSFNLKIGPDSSFIIYASRAYYIAGYTYKWVAWGKM